MSYDLVDVPEDGDPITYEEESDELVVPENPIIPIIYGDGTGIDVGPAAQKVLQAAAEATGRHIEWMRVYAGESAREKYDENLPDDTVDAIREFRVAIKGPLTTPVGAGFRSLNVALRQKLDLYANVRPTYYLEGIPSPVKAPEKMDMIMFRENTEDVYAGIEWKAGTDEAEQVRDFVEQEMGFDETIHDGLGVRGRRGGVRRGGHHRGHALGGAGRRAAGGRGRGQRPHRGQHAPAAVDPDRGVRRTRPAEPQRRLPL